MAHSGTNSNRRLLNVSYWGPLRPHLLQIGRLRPWGLDVDQDFAAVVGETSVAVNETLLLFNAVEDSLELNLVRCEA